jgi:trk system potassium uptake protein TrkH
MFAKLVLVFLMFIGACAGSTGGGIKVSRILISAKAVKKELYRLIHPRNVKVLKLDGKKVEHETMRIINVFLFAYAIVFVTSLFVVSLDNFEFSGTFTAVAATLNNIGPGLGQVGPMSNFSEFSVLSKCVLMFDMLAGRLEIFPMLLLLVPATWKRQ